MKREVARLISGLLAKIAQKTASTTYSMAYLYSPEIPNELTKE